MAAPGVSGLIGGRLAIATDAVTGKREGNSWRTVMGTVRQQCGRQPGDMEGERGATLRATETAHNQAKYEGDTEGDSARQGGG